MTDCRTRFNVESRSFHTIIQPCASDRYYLGTPQAGQLSSPRFASVLERIPGLREHRLCSNRIEFVSYIITAADRHAKPSWDAGLTLLYERGHVA
jgi:hypothetical protein